MNRENFHQWKEEDIFMYTVIEYLFDIVMNTSLFALCGAYLYWLVRLASKTLL